LNKQGIGEYKYMQANGIKKRRKAGRKAQGVA
jgi:hypothetical protein